MSRIAGEFCTWLRDLPGEDTKVPHLCTQAVGPHAYLPCYVHLCHSHLAFYPTHIHHIRYELFKFKPRCLSIDPSHPPKRTDILMWFIIIIIFLMLKVNRLGEDHLRALFDTAQSANPGNTKLAEGLR